MKLSEMPQVEMFCFVLISLWVSVLGLEPASKVVADRYAVYWNRTNPRWVSYLRSWYTIKRRFTSAIQKHHSPQYIGRNIARLRTEQVCQAVRIVWTSFTDDTTVTRLQGRNFEQYVLFYSKLYMKVWQEKAHGIAKINEARIEICTLAVCWRG